MRKFPKWLTVILTICFLTPITGYVTMAPDMSSLDEGTSDVTISDNAVGVETEGETEGESDEPFYPDFPDLPAPPAPNSPYYAVASPPPDYLTSENRASRIKFNTTTVISIDSPKNLDFVTLGQSFIVSGGIYEDNNSNGKNDTGDLPIPNAMLHFRWARQPGFIDTMTDVNGKFSVTIPNDISQLAPIAHLLEAQFWGQWTINGTVFYEIPRYNISTNMPGFDDDGDENEKTQDGIDNDGDWKGWDGTNYNDDLNHNNQTDVNYDGVPFFDDDGDGDQDEETLNGVDDDADGLVDEDCAGGDANGDFDSGYDPEPNVDEPGEGIDEEGVPNGMDTDGDTMIDEDNLLPFIPRLNSTIQMNLIIQHITEISLSVSPKNAQIGDEVSLSGQLKDPDTSTPVGNKWMHIKFHGQEIDVNLTDSEGKFSLKYIIPAEVGGDVINVGRRQFTAQFDQSYEPDFLTYYKSSARSVDVSIKRPTMIEITNVDKNVYLQSTFTITGRVTDETGAPLLFTIANDDGTKNAVSTSDYKVTLMWGKSAASWAPPPKPGFLGPSDNFSITLTLENPLQPLGRVEVTVTFVDLTDKYYLPSQNFDEFIVRAHSKIIEWEDVKGYHRGDTAYIRGRLVRQDGSIQQGLADAQLEARWGPGVPFENLTEATRADGDFTYVHYIEEAHQLGPVVVYMRFDGTNYLQGYVDGFEHTEQYAHKTFYVIAQPVITLDGGDIVKGESYSFTGKLVDDTGKPMTNQYVELYFSTNPIINTETGEWEPDDPPIAFIPTDNTGTFSYDYIIPESFLVGEAFGAARFKGFQPPYNASNAYDEAITWNVEYNISSKTAVIIDQQYASEDLFRGHDFVITGKVVETYKDELTPIKVKPIHGEKLQVDLYMTARGVPDATTHKVGDATIGKTGLFQLRAKVPANIEISDEVDVTLVFNGNIRYERSTNTSIHKLWGYVFFDRAEILSSFPEKDEKGRPAIHEDQFNYKSDNFREPLIIQIPIFEDVQGRAPPPVANATVYLNFSESYFVNTSVEMTDSNGIATFEFISPLKDKDYPDRIKLLHREKERYVLEVTITFVGDTGLQPESTNFNISYYPTPPPGQDTLWGKYSTVLSILIIITIILVIFMIAFSSWYIKQQRLRGLKRIIKRAADQLIAGDQYRATIYKSYKKLSTHLRRYGYLRREAETFREFENAIRSALPIDRVSMHRFLDLLEEARYSQHKIGESQRQAAISNLRSIEGSLSEIIIDEEAAMRALRKLEEEEKEMAAAETEIIVKPGAEDGSSMPPAGGPPALPPGQ